MKIAGRLLKIEYEYTSVIHWIYNKLCITDTRNTTQLFYIQFYHCFINLLYQLVISMFYTGYPFQINSIFVLSVCYIHVLSTIISCFINLLYQLVISMFYTGNPFQINSIFVLSVCYIHVLSTIISCFINLLYPCFTTSTLFKSTRNLLYQQEI